MAKYAKYAYLGVRNMVNWGVPEKILQNAVSCIPKFRLLFFLGHPIGHGLYTPASRTLNLARWLIHRRLPLKLIHRVAHFVSKPDYIDQNWLMM